MFLKIYILYLQLKSFSFPAGGSSRCNALFHPYSTEPYIGRNARTDVSYVIMYDMKCTHRTALIQLIKSAAGNHCMERKRERKRKNVPCLSIHGIITVMGIMIDRFVHTSIRSIHTSINSIYQKEGRKGNGRTANMAGDHNIFFPFPLSLYPFFQNPFPCSRLWGMGYGK